MIVLIKSVSTGITKMKKNFLQIIAIGAIAFLLSIPVFAQRDRTVSPASELYVISAKAGGVNFIEGSVTVMRVNGKSSYLLRNDKLEIGDKVTTGSMGRAEILLNPGSYIRLAPNSEFEFITTSLDDLKLKLNRGSAMFEVFAANKFKVEVNAQNTKFYLIQSGVYRVDAGNGEAKIEVFEGKAQIGDANPTVVKEGRAASVEAGEVAVVKFDRDNKDALESWSKSRAKELAKLNARLERNTLRNTLIYSYRSNSWNWHNSFGLWIADASFSGYCFVPFGYGWYSPYGYNFGWNFWNIRLPTYIYYPPTGNGNGNGNGTVTVNGNGTSSDTQSGGAIIRDSAPPFQQMPGGIGGGRTRKLDPMTTVDDSPGFPVRQPAPPVTVPAPVSPKSPKSN